MRFDRPGEKRSLFHWDGRNLDAAGGCLLCVVRLVVLSSQIPARDFVQFSPLSLSTSRVPFSSKPNVTRKRSRNVSCNCFASIPMGRANYPVCVISGFHTCRFSAQRCFADAVGVIALTGARADERPLSGKKRTCFSWADERVRWRRNPFRRQYLAGARCQLFVLLVVLNRPKSLHEVSLAIGRLGQLMA